MHIDCLEVPVRDDGKQSDRLKRKADWYSEQILTGDPLKEACKAWKCLNIITQVIKQLNPSMFTDHVPEESGDEEEPAVVDGLF